MKITDVRVLPSDSGFLFDDGKTSILYDTGFAFTGERLAQNVQKILKNRQLDFIFLTHSHIPKSSKNIVVSAVKFSSLLF